MRSKVMLWMAIGVVAPVAAGCASTVTPAAVSAPSSVKAVVGGTTSGTATASGADAQFPIPTGFDANRNATADIQSALRLAKTSHKEVLLDFGADWCPDCVALDTLFHTTQVETLLNSDYVVVPIDVGNWDLNISTASQYVDLTTSGIPALVVISGGGQEREATNDGSFSNARTLGADQVADFLTSWAPGSSQ